MAVPGEGTYVCNLDEETQKKAESELYENPKERASKIQRVREWLKTHPYVTSRTDDDFILRFLRLCKFDVLDTQKRIEKFCINRSSAIDGGAPEWFNPQDVDDPKIRELLEYPFQFPLPKPKGKKDGPCYLIAQSKYCNSKYEVKDLMKAMFMSLDTLVMDENVQVHGLYFIQDMKGQSMDHMKIWTPETMKKCMKVWKDVYPTRVKQMNYLHMPVFMQAVFEVIKLLMGKKLRERMKIYHEPKDLTKKIPKECLPNEYGGTAGTIDELYAKHREDILNNRHEFELLRECWVDEKKMPREEPDGDSWGMVGSFRKLET